MIGRRIPDVLAKRTRLLEASDNLRAQIDRWLEGHSDGATSHEVSFLMGLLGERRLVLQQLMENNEAMVDYYVAMLSTREGAPG